MYPEELRELIIEIFQSHNIDVDILITTPRMQYMIEYILHGIYSIYNGFCRWTCINCDPPPDPSFLELLGNYEYDNNCDGCGKREGYCTCKCVICNKIEYCYCICSKCHKYGNWVLQSMY